MTKHVNLGFAISKIGFRNKHQACRWPASNGKEPTSSSFSEITEFDRGLWLSNIHDMKIDYMKVKNSTSSRSRSLTVQVRPPFQFPWWATSDEWTSLLSINTSFEILPFLCCWALVRGTLLSAVLVSFDLSSKSKLPFRGKVKFYLFTSLWPDHHQHAILSDHNKSMTITNNKKYI